MKAEWLQELSRLLEAEGLVRLALLVRFLPAREAPQDDPLAPGSWVGIQTGGIETQVLLVPQEGGHVLRFQESPLQILSPESPLGQAILGRRVGESVTLPSGSGLRTVQILWHR